MKFITYGPEGTAESLHLAEGPSPVPAAGEILIEVHYAGVNRPDVLQRMGRYAPPPGASPVLGLEVAGRVVGLGADVSQWRLGDAVCALVPGGGYAQLCVAPARHALPIPSGLSLAEASGLPENWFTVWANLIDLAGLHSGERVLIHGGSSGIGLAAIQLARHVGAQAIVTVGNEDKQRFCREFGAAEAINYRTEDFVLRTREFTAGAGVDVVLDMVGGSYIPRNVALLRRDGRLVFIAFLLGSRCELDFTPIMVKRLRVTGSTMRPRSTEEKAAIRDALAGEIWPGFAAGRIRTHLAATFPLEQACEAHRLMESSRHIGKIVLQVDSSATGAMA
ncbi:MAG TPA: NAD(P)H-quinone oxidoreductase [Steroidobacteraceae bacterium]|jgi:putative PIG3 family NAD(P)H quinone oxidoreductase|nr:NAD(P)H-quinone oxidoreductase [Steroidobacteraceae bacterium]